MSNHLSYFYHFICLTLLICLTGSCSVKARIKKADKKFDIGEYYEAGNMYQQIYKRVNAKDKQTRAYVAFKQGECNRLLNNPKALNAYKSAIRNRYNDSIVYLRQAQVLHYQGKYADAAKNYETYLVSHPDDDLAKNGLIACKNVAEWKKEYTRYKISVAKEFNAKRSSSFAPRFIGDDDDALMFTSNRTPASKKSKKFSGITGAPVNALYSTRKNAAGKWEEIEPTEGLTQDDVETSDAADNSSEQGSAQNSAGGGTDLGINTKDKTTPDIGVCCFSADGKTMYFTYSKPINGQDQGAQIYVSNRASGTWGEPQRVKLFEDSTITCAHPALSHSGDTLYFISDAEGGQGGKDIWFAENTGEGWGIPENLGAPLNTKGDEMFPTIREDGTIYFSSNGHPGYGGLDIIKAVPTEQGWLLYNMGAPFNSENDDFGITFEKGKENGFFSSNRGQKKGFDLIYSFQLPEMIFMVEGTVNDNNGENLTDAMLRLVGNDGTNQKIQVKRDGTYKIKLKKDVRYIMLARARGHLNQKQELSTLDLKDTKIFHQDFTLMPISKPVTMNNIFYEFGKYTLTPQSEQGLMQLVKLLNDNPNITIELSAHTDRVGNDQANKTLSEKRAQSVVDFLISKGIEKDRLTPVGYGKEKPVVADKQIHQKYPFIPIEQALDESFIDTLTKDQQDICNTLNRRTEFKVLSTTYKLY